MLNLYGHPMSTCTRKVLMTLAETNTPFEMDLVDLMKGEHKQERHLTRQPFGRVPAIDDDGFKLFESRAIIRYLAQKTGSTLVPTDLKARAKMEQWISIETSEFSEHAMKFALHHLFKREQEPAVLEAATKALQTTLAVMDKQLASTSYLVGNEFTLADIGFMPYLEYTLDTPVKDIYARYPHVMAWWDRIAARPTWKKVTGKV